MTLVRKTLLELEESLPKPSPPCFNPIMPIFGNKYGEKNWSSKAEAESYFSSDYFKKETIIIASPFLSQHLFAILVAQARKYKTTELYDTSDAVSSQGLLSDFQVKKIWIPKPAHLQFIVDVAVYSQLSIYNSKKVITTQNILEMDQSIHVKRAKQLTFPNPASHGLCYIGFSHHEKVIYYDITYSLDPVREHSDQPTPSPRQSCHNCHMTPTEGKRPLLLCGRCKKVYYCSAQCQKIDYKEHKKCCKELD